MCFVEADTGIYSFFFVGGGGGRGGCKTIFFFLGGGGKPFAIEGQTADFLRKIMSVTCPYTGAFCSSVESI